MAFIVIGMAGTGKTTFVNVSLKYKSSNYKNILMPSRRGIIF